MSRLLEAIKQQLSDSRHMKGAPITIESVEGVYVPIFITRTTFQGTWIGYHTAPLFTTGGGGEQGPDANKVWSSGSVDETADYPLIASISDTQFGVELIHRTLFDQQPVDLSDVDWNAVENTLLPIDIDTSKLNQLPKGTNHSR